jgi:hypothetical protein
LKRQKYEFSTGDWFRASERKSHAMNEANYCNYSFHLSFLSRCKCRLKYTTEVERVDNDGLALPATIGIYEVPTDGADAGAKAKGFQRSSCENLWARGNLSGHLVNLLCVP